MDVGSLNRYGRWCVGRHGSARRGWVQRLAERTRARSAFRYPGVATPNRGVKSMNATQPTADDNYARGLALAAHSLIVELLRVLIKTGALIDPDLQTLLSEAEKDLKQPQFKDAEVVALEAIALAREALQRKA